MKPFSQVDIFPDIVVKKHLKDKFYEKEKFFYLTYQHLFDFIPELLSFNDESKMLIFKNVGCVIKKENIDFVEVKRINDILINHSIYQNDYRTKNILYDVFTNKYFIIDFELWDTEYKDFRKTSVKQDIRKNLF